jgi:hypothetical protein
VIGSIWTLIVLALALLWPSPALVRAGLFLTVVVALLAGAAFLTGEPAEEKLETLPGVVEPAMHEHEEAAERALYLSIAAGVLALGTLIGARPPGRKAVVGPFLVLAAAALLLGIAAHEGGKIHRPELASPGSMPVVAPGGEAGEEDES